MTASAVGVDDDRPAGPGQLGEVAGGGDQAGQPAGQASRMAMLKPSL